MKPLYWQKACKYLSQKDPIIGQQVSTKAAESIWSLMFSKRWQPYRTVVTWLLWNSFDNEVIAY